MRASSACMSNYYSFHQEFAATYFPMKTLEISAEAGLTFNAKNPATATFDIDWGINWAPIASTTRAFEQLAGSKSIEQAIESALHNNT